jgi:hypothetical protein
MGMCAEGMVWWDGLGVVSAVLAGMFGRRMRNVHKDGGARVAAC